MYDDDGDNAGLKINSMVLPEEKNPFIEEVIKILWLFEAVTTELSAKKYVSASKILLARGLQKLMTSYTGIGWMLAEKIDSTNVYQVWIQHGRKICFGSGNLVRSEVQENSIFQ